MSIIKKLINTNLIRLGFNPIVCDNSKLQYQALGKNFSHSKNYCPDYNYFDKMAIMHAYGTLRKEEEDHSKPVSSNTKKSIKVTPDHAWTQDDIDYFHEMAMQHAFKS